MHVHVGTCTKYRQARVTDEVAVVAELFPAGSARAAGRGGDGGRARLAAVRLLTNGAVLDGAVLVVPQPRLRLVQRHARRVLGFVCKDRHARARA